MTIDVGGQGWVPGGPGSGSSNAEPNPHAAKYDPQPMSSAQDNVKAINERPFIVCDSTGDGS
jgi:hypothetical protein